MGKVFNYDMKSQGLFSFGSGKDDLTGPNLSDGLLVC